MRDLAEIKRINSAKGVGAKLGADNGNSSRLYDRQMMTRQQVATRKRKAPWDEPDPTDHATPINPQGIANAPLVEAAKNALALQEPITITLIGPHGRVIL